MNLPDHMDRIIAYAADHRAQLLKEAATDRLLQETQSAQPSATGRVLAGVGDLLIATGKWLKGDRESLVPPVR